jgi:LmbE family N-acetylglucosaminyl deacetylase
MKLSNPNASIFIPDAAPEPEALARTTHLGIGAHQDDLEFMAFHGIITCYESSTEWFSGVTCTDGAGSARTGPYEKCSDDEMRAIRTDEQNRAAQIGRYGAMFHLAHTSAAAKDPHGTALRDDLLAILRATRPRVVYTHNPADKHDTHIGVMVAAIEAMRALPPEDRPAEVYGCEGWRNLDWMPDDEKIIHNVGGHEDLAVALNGVFDSQIAGGKRYDLGVIGRRRMNAVFFDSHAVDRSDSVAFAMDLTPLVKDASFDIPAYVDAIVTRFRNDVQTRLHKRLGR